MAEAKERATEKVVEGAVPSDVSLATKCGHLLGGLLMQNTLPSVAARRSREKGRNRL